MIQVSLLSGSFGPLIRVGDPLPSNNFLYIEMDELPSMIDQLRQIQQDLELSEETK